MRENSNSQISNFQHQIGRNNQGNSTSLKKYTTNQNSKQQVKGNAPVRLTNQNSA